MSVAWFIIKGTTILIQLILESVRLESNVNQILASEVVLVVTHCHLFTSVHQVDRHPHPIGLARNVLLIVFYYTFFVLEIVLVFYLKNTLIQIDYLYSR